MTRHLLCGLVALVTRLSPWQGTVTGLLAALPPGAFQSGAPQLARVLRASSGALPEWGVSVSFRREAGTGRRLIALTAVPGDALRLKILSGCGVGRDVI